MNPSAASNVSSPVEPSLGKEGAVGRRGQCGLADFDVLAASRGTHDLFGPASALGKSNSAELAIDGQ